MGSVVAAVTAMLLVLSFLNDPFTNSIGGLQPDAMERTLVLMDQAVTAADVEVTVPCDASGHPM
jgi:ethanolamine utilization microcompartment shell protein EutL